MLYVSLSEGMKFLRESGMQFGSVPWQLILENVPQEIGIVSSTDTKVDGETILAALGERTIVQRLHSSGLVLQKFDAALFIDIKAQTGVILYWDENVVEKMNLRPKLEIVFS